MDRMGSRFGSHDGGPRVSRSCALWGRYTPGRTASPSKTHLGQTCSGEGVGIPTPADSAVGGNRLCGFGSRSGLSSAIGRGTNLGALGLYLLPGNWNLQATVQDHHSLLPTHI